jgi:stringent starvation protein B
MSVSALTPSPISTRPYLLRALYEWCTDNGYTPYIAAYVDQTVQVPMEHVKNNEIVLNISMDATSALRLGNEFVEFKARFSGTARQIMVPIDRVIAIYARENGQGMAFPVPQAVAPRGEVAEPPAKMSLAGKKSPESPTDTLSDTTISTIEAASAAPPTPSTRVVQLVAALGETTSHDGSDPPTPPPQAPAGSRPALKRVK